MRGGGGPPGHIEPAEMLPGASTGRGRAGRERDAACDWAPELESRRLGDLSLRAGGEDNITVVAVHVVG